MDVQQDGEDTASHTVISRCLSVSGPQEVEQPATDRGPLIRYTKVVGVFRT